MELFCCSVGNIPDGVMRAAERLSHMGSMKVSLSTAKSVIAAAAVKMVSRLHYIVFLSYVLKGESSPYFWVYFCKMLCTDSLSVTFEILNVSLEISVKSNE